MDLRLSMLTKAGLNNDVFTTPHNPIPIQRISGRRGLSAAYKHDKTICRKHTKKTFFIAKTFGCLSKRSKCKDSCRADNPYSIE